MASREPSCSLTRLCNSWVSSFEDKRHTLLAIFYATFFLRASVDLLRLWDPAMTSYRRTQWPIEWLRAFGLSLPSEAVYFTTIAGLFLAVLFPFVFWARLLAGGVFFLSSAYLSSVDAPGHSKAISVLAALVFAWPWLLSKRESLFRWIAILQVYVISIYVSAGLWKLRFFLSGGFESGRWSALAIHHWQENIAQVLASGSLSEKLVFHSWILSSDVLSSFLFATSVIFQIGLVILVFFPRFLSFGLIPILLFHFGALMTVGVSYRLHVAFCTLLFLGSSLAAPEKRVFLTRRLAVTLTGGFLVLAQVVLPRVSFDGEV
ncbi:MAG TPA: hypothetical protein PL182_01675 [Pseudobdellovibrionaceae bacterium]|nr:hypothetical protein [Pseudobdellovibrionaceae bacterium]